MTRSNINLECLAKFWFGARKDLCDDNDETDDDPEMKNHLYSANILKSFRYGINCILKSKGHLYDIIYRKTASFTKSQQAFSDALKELKSEGKADVNSYPEIQEEDQVKIYNHKYMDPDNTPDSLQRKVQFDVHLYFACRGCENMEKMKVKDFQLKFDQKQELWYMIKIKDELTKNHKEIGEVVSGIMPENRDLCPVQSFKKYLDHLHPENEYLWQSTLKKVNPFNPVWYGRQHLRKNTLGNFMNEVSLNCELGSMYTNHSIRVTGITILTRMQFSPSEIMAVSGHKSVQSLSNYQCTQPKQKISTGNVLYQSMTRKEEDIQRPQPKGIETSSKKAIVYDAQAMSLQTTPHTPLQKNLDSSTALVPYESDFGQDDIPDFDLVSILNDMEAEEKSSKKK